MAKKYTEATAPVRKTGADCIIKNLQVSCRGDINYLGEKGYRTVFAVGEIERLYADTLFVNKHFGEKGWEAEINLRLFWFDGQKAVNIAEKVEKMKVKSEEEEVRYTALFTKEEISWKEGVFRLIVEINGAIAESEDIYVIEGNGKLEEYVSPLHTGIDKLCDETDEEANARPHSFCSLNKSGLKDIRFFLLANNLLNHQWVYEFGVRVLNRDGSTKAMKLVKSAQYVKNEAGNDLLCFTTDLGGDSEEFWTAGEYTLIVSGFDQVMLTLNFTVANKDIVYNFEQEVKMGGAAPVFGQKLPFIYSDKEKEDILDRIYRLVGLRKVKEEITHMAEYAEFIRLRKENGFSDKLPQMHLIFTGHPGTGKNTVAEMIGELYQKMGLLQNGRVLRCGRNDLVKEGVVAEEQLVRKAISLANGGVLVVDTVGDLWRPENPNDRGVMALSVLLNILSKEQPEVLVILTDETDEIENILQTLPELGRIFPRQLCFEDYTPDELMEITRNKLEKLQYRFTPMAEAKFYKLLEAACVSNEFDFTNGNYIDERLEDATSRMARRLMANSVRNYGKEDLMLITDADIVEEEVESPEKSLERLHAMIGLKELKQSLQQHLNYVYFIRERQKHGFTDKMPPLNMIFSGNPGTGKMTVAKMISEIYYSLGILSNPNIVVQDGHHLSSEEGITPQQIAGVLLEASAGSILYIDHADVLPRSEFGLAVLEIVLSVLSVEGNGNVIVVLGGNPDQMDKMLEANPALKNYFPYRFQFNDYTAEELFQIAETKLEEKDYVFQPKAKETFQGLIRKAIQTKDKYFGNALLVDKMVEQTIRNMSDRMIKTKGERELTRQEMTNIRQEDIPVDLFEKPGLGKDIFDEEEIKAALNELNHMVGQSRVKKQIHDFVDVARHYSSEGIKLSSRMSLQWCFTGNAAMGKGTVARIIARIYKAMGIIPTGKVLDFKVENLIGLIEDEAQRVIGDILMKSNGGILLFDEDSPRLNEVTGLREHIRAILTSQMAERPGSYILIYAEPKASLLGFNGSAEHMQELVNVLVFEDYTKEELMMVLKRRLEKERMKLTPLARKYMAVFITLLVSTEERSRSSSRLMRIVADMIVRNCLQRIARSHRKPAVEELISVQKKDVQMFTEQFVATLISERKRIGFI